MPEVGHVWDPVPSTRALRRSAPASYVPDPSTGTRHRRLEFGEYQESDVEKYRRQETECFGEPEGAEKWNRQRGDEELGPE